jgi:transmembrane sensor
VHAAGVDVRAVGTAFNVRLGPAAVEVLVTEGRVQVESPAARPGIAGSEPPLVDAGHRAIVPLEKKEPLQILAVTPAESARLLAWQVQLLDFSSTPLERAITEFNRRNRVQFVLADRELAPMPIVASIRSDNVEGFAAFLAAIPGVQVEHRGETEIVLRRKK